MSTNFLVFDIETVGLDFDSFDEKQQEYLLRRAETDEERAQKIAELALSPVTGRIVCIGMMNVKLTDADADMRSVAYMVDAAMSDDDELRSEELPSGATCYYSSERVMLENFWKLLASQRDLHLISFNGRNFDAPWLMLRSAFLGLRPTRNLMDGTKWNYRAHTDLADELTFYSKSFSGPLRLYNFDMYAKTFGVTSPKEAGVDGSMVGELFAKGALVDIAEYCLRDVRSTWDLYRKWDETLGPGSMA
jgi:3'-5' exonuclease